MRWRLVELSDLAAATAPQWMPVAAMGTSAAYLEEICCSRRTRETWGSHQWQGWLQQIVVWMRWCQRSGFAEVRPVQ